MAKGRYQQWLTPDSLTLLQAWKRDGLTDEQIAKKCGISAATLYRWKDKHCEFCEALKKGAEAADIEVENALFKRAIGYEYVETKVKREAGKLTETTTTVKHVVPDVGAIAFWLKNRRPDKWRDKPEPVRNQGNELMQALLDAVGGNDNAMER